MSKLHLMLSIYIQSKESFKFQTLEWITPNNPLLINTVSTNYIGRYLTKPIEKNDAREEHL